MSGKGIRRTLLIALTFCVIDVVAYIYCVKTYGWNSRLPTLHEMSEFVSQFKPTWNNFSDAMRAIGREWHEVWLKVSELLKRGRL